MSFILEALKKSESERQRQAGPALLEMRIVRPTHRLPIWALAVGFLLMGAISLSQRRAAFISSVTHELRTPLTTFRMYTEMLVEGMASDPAKQSQYHRTLYRESDRLVHLVENVLSYARLVRPEHESAGKKCGFGKKKIGNAHLRWAFGEAITLFDCRLTCGVFGVSLADIYGVLALGELRGCWEISVVIDGVHARPIKFVDSGERFAWLRNHGNGHDATGDIRIRGVKYGSGMLDGVEILDHSSQLVVSLSNCFANALHALGGYTLSFLNGDLLRQFFQLLGKLFKSRWFARRLLDEANSRPPLRSSPGALNTLGILGSNPMF